MEMLSILTGLRRHKTMCTLIVVQVALTICIVSNSLFVIHERLTRIDRPSGLNESDLVLFRNEWIGGPQDLKARLEKDLSLLRSMPGVVDALATNVFHCPRAARWLRCEWKLGKNDRRQGLPSILSICTRSRH